MSAAPMTYPVISTPYGNALAAVPGVIHPSQIVNVSPWMWQAGFGAGWAWLLAQLPAAWHIHWAFTAVPLGFLAFRAFWIVLETRCLSYSFDGERISWMAGVLSRTSGSIEAHRIQTVYMDQTFIERLVDVGSVTLKTQDGTDQQIIIVGAKKPEQLRAWLTAYVRRARQQGGFQEVFVG